MNKEKHIQKILKLLELWKSDKTTCEAQTAYTKAQELCEKYNITEEDLITSPNVVSIDNNESLKEYDSFVKLITLHNLPLRKAEKIINLLKLIGSNHTIAPIAIHWNVEMQMMPFCIFFSRARFHVHIEFSSESIHALHAIIKVFATHYQKCV